MSAPSPRRLLLSIHDVGPRFEGEVDRLRAMLGRRVPHGRIAMLVVPNHWGEAPIVAGSPFAARLRAWADQGTEIFLHGWFHRDDGGHRGSLTRFKARHMTAGEGEFVGLDKMAAAARMRDGRSLLEDITGRPVAGFVAPAWLYSAGTHEALAEFGFALAEDHWRVWQPATGRVLASDPVLTWASRSRLRRASSLAVAKLLPPILRHRPTARVAVHPGDTGVPALMRSIDTAVTVLLRSHGPSRYADLVGTHTDCGAAPALTS